MELCVVDVNAIEYGKEITLPVFQGEARDFHVGEIELHVSAELDKFNTYRKIYKKLAKDAADSLTRTYNKVVVDLDKFLIEFPKMYVFYRAPLLEAAVNNLIAEGVYDASLESFAQDHTATFCLVNEDLTTMEHSCELTIQNNQQRKINNFNLIPGFIFSGPLGLAAATATNVGLTAIESAAVRNAKITPAQRKELFNRINPAILLERAYLDYWRVFCSLTYKLYTSGKNNFYLTEDGNKSATSLLDNLLAGKLPESCHGDVFQQLIDKNPYQNRFREFLTDRYGNADGVNELLEYLDI